MSAEDFQLIDDEKIDDSIIKRDFISICRYASFLSTFLSIIDCFKVFI